MCICKKNNIIHEEDPIPFQDRVLRKLQDMTTEVILDEIRKNTGKIIKEDTEVLRMLKQK